MMFVCPRLRVEQFFVRRDAINVSDCWDLMGKPVVRNANADVWLLGEGASDHNDALLSL